MAKSTGRAAAADLLRVISIFIIAWYHIWQQSWLNPDFTIAGRTINMYPVVSHGYMFVDIMLLISGFLLMLGYIDGRYKSLKSYYISRFFRIVPSYLLCVLFMLFFIALPRGAYGSTEYMLKDLISHLTFLHNLLPEGYTSSQLNIVLWTLAVEVQFYVIFPFIAKLFNKAPVWTYLALIAVCAASKYWVYAVPENKSLYINRLPAMLDVYANGMMAALIYSKLRNFKKLPALRAVVCLVLCIAACWAVYRIQQQQSYLGDSQKERIYQMIFRWPLTFAGSVFLVAGSLGCGWMSNPITRFLGLISYNFYIWHQFIAVRLKEWHIPAYTGENPNFSGQQPWQTQYTYLCFAAALLIAVLLTFTVEKPFSRLGSHIKARTKSHLLQN